MKQVFTDLETAFDEFALAGAKAATGRALPEVVTDVAAGAEVRAAAAPIKLTALEARELDSILMPAFNDDAPARKFRAWAPEPGFD